MECLTDTSIPLVLQAADARNTLREEVIPQRLDLVLIPCDTYPDGRVGRTTTNEILMN